MAEGEDVQVVEQSLDSRADAADERVHQVPAGVRVEATDLRQVLPGEGHARIIRRSASDAWGSHGEHGGVKQAEEPVARRVEDHVDVRLPPRDAEVIDDRLSAR